MNRVREQLEAQEGQKMLFVYDKDIPSGIVGLIAGRISDEYYRPVMVMTMVGEQIVGSGRSIEQFDITKALFQASEFLSRYGGHPQACGFTLNSPEVLEKFKHVLLEAAQGSIIDDDLVPIVEIDAMAQPGELTLGLVKEIDKFAPFGEGNIKPKFWIKNLQITAMDKLGNGEKHLRLMAKAEDSYVALKFMGFGMVDRFKDLIAVGDKIDLVAEIGINVWNGNESVESRIVDIKKVSKRVSF
jgi:single-stranded-DNA-specific exonuclease